MNINETQYYCRFGEDNILDRLTGYAQTGFYIDVGAHSANSESITKCFYDRGWNGINVEPQQVYFDELMQYRPKDLNLQVAVSSTSGELELHVNGGLTTATLEYSLPEWPVIKVPMTTLELICEKYIGNKQIDFLKVDVEGHELDVIVGMNWDKFRPKILCVEATKPNTTIDVFDDWEPLLIKAGYQFVEKNPYNRFYKDAT